MADTPNSDLIDHGGIRPAAGCAPDLVRDRNDPATFTSILFERPEDRSGDDALAPPAYFIDLNCDQIVAAITAGRDEYNLKPFFYQCLRHADALAYRHAVMQDLQDPALHDAIGSFAQGMRDVRGHLRQVEKVYYKEQKQAWFLDAVATYCRTIGSLTADLAQFDIRARGFLRFRHYLARYARSARYAALLSDANKLQADLATIEYCVLIRGSGFTVCKYRGEADYSIEVEQTFDKFEQGAVKDYRVKFSKTADMNHIEAKILEFVAQLHPEVFTALDDFCARNGNFIDPTMVVFDREVQFYLAYLEQIAPLMRAGLPFCYPRFSERSTDVYDYDAFDIALARKRVNAGSSVVCNDFQISGNERVLVVSGPNQGGKTTFARTFGQLHHLACLGCPVPGRAAQLLLFDQLFTHFEKQEKVDTLRGKLEDDLVRVHDILSRATPRSIIIMNEIFTSTTIHDEILLSRKVMEKILRLGAICVWVTFVDELAAFSPQTVSMVSMVVPDNPALRTFKVVRRPADGLAYATAIAQKYRLTYDTIKARIKS